jgi:D-glycero-alpha-D-manno-heptose-7-phosphate kinase
MKVRSRAPLRLGLAGGGTDVSPYSDEYGGAVLNATINLFVHAFLDDEVSENKIIFTSLDLGITEELSLDDPVDLGGALILHRAVYKRIMEKYNHGQYIPMRITTQSDAPAGSGLGSSSTVVLALLEVFRQFLSLPLGEYDLASIAYEIERGDCGLAGGKQDQYAAAFGGFNFMEFSANNKVIVNPLRIRRHIINELECSMVLFFLGVSRDSGAIIEDQINAIQENTHNRLAALHKVKESAYTIKELLFKGQIPALAKEFGKSWDAKKATSNLISNSMIDSLHHEVCSAGAWSFKVSGAGGGGFAVILVAPEKRQMVINTLRGYSGEVHPFQFYSEGVHSWTV